eukprot:1005094-Amphidinium_carterae.1
MRPKATQNIYSDIYMGPETANSTYMQNNLLQANHRSTPTVTVPTTFCTTMTTTNMQKSQTRPDC